MKRSRQRGFSLLELLIVIFVVTTLSAMAVPNLLKARQNAYEASAVGFMHTLQADQLAYRVANDSYAKTFDDLPELLAGGGTGPNATGSASGSASGKGKGKGNKGQGQGNGQSRGKGQGQGRGQGQGNGAGNGKGNNAYGGQGGQGGQGSSGPANTPFSTSAMTSVVVHANYIFTLTWVNDEQWNCTAQPAFDRYNGQYYYTDETGVIRSTKGAIPTATSQIVQ